MPVWRVRLPNRHRVSHPDVRGHPLFKVERGEITLEATDLDEPWVERARKLA